ncbi:MAG: cytochrome c [Myxococcales bacterium]|nr:cytochrome c [Myxococcales bacterium]
MNKRFFAFIVMAAALAGCAAGLPAANASDVERARGQFPGATGERLAKGRSLYVQTCAGCHTLKSPDEVPPAQWADEIAEMRQTQGVQLTDDDASAMAEYLWAVSSRLREESANPGAAAR